MNCVSCGAASELAENKCLKCTHEENTILRLMIGHVIMSIENGQVSGEAIAGKRVYRQQFGEAFLDHLKHALAGVNIQPTDSPPAPPAESGSVGHGEG